MNDKEIAGQILEIARKHEGKGDMACSAVACLVDAENQYHQGWYEYSIYWSIRSLTYSVGIFHEDYKRAMELRNLIYH